MIDPVKTWSVVADKMGGHWHVTVRRGIEGSRARIGELTFDLSDVTDARSRLEYMSVRVMVRTVSKTIEHLGQRHLLGALATPGALAEIAVEINDALKSECGELALETFLQTFGVRLDLAKVNG